MFRILVGVVMICAFASILSRCGSSNTAEAVPIYPNVAACTADHSASDCDQAFGSAQAQHDSSAPHYASQSSCEDVYGPGQCVPRTGGSGGWFIPAMAVFMLGQALSGPNTFLARPVYVDRQGYAYSGNYLVGPYRRRCEDQGNCPSGYSSGYHGGGGYIFRRSGSSGTGFWSSGSFASRSVTVPRGGFGGSSSAMSSFFGGSHSALGAGGSVSRGGFGSSAAAHAGGLGS